MVDRDVLLEALEIVGLVLARLRVDGLELRDVPEEAARMVAEAEAKIRGGDC